MNDEMINLNLENVMFTNNKGSISIDLKKSIPQKLYKYYALKNHNVKGLENSTIYFSQANLLNDILEGNFELIWNFENFKESDKIIKAHKDFIINNISNYKKDFLRYRGIFSMSDNLKNELLWIHYTNESGYCIEFRSNELISFFKLNNDKEQNFYFPISYPKTLEQVDFDKLYIDIKETGTIDIKLAILNCFAIKENYWNYEKEWRIVLNNEKFNYFSQPTSIIDDKIKIEETDGLIGGNVDIERSLICKIVLAPLFFNNSRFNKFEKMSDKYDYEIFNFKDSPDGKLTREFLKILHKFYPDKIYQIDKVIRDKKVCRDLKFKIEILFIGDGFVKLKKQLL